MQWGRVHPHVGWSELAGLGHRRESRDGPRCCWSARGLLFGIVGHLAPRSLRRTSMMGAVVIPILGAGPPPQSSGRNVRTTITRARRVSLGATRRRPRPHTTDISMTRPSSPIVHGHGHAEVPARRQRRVGALHQRCSVGRHWAHEQWLRNERSHAPFCPSPSLARRPKRIDDPQPSVERHPVLHVLRPQRAAISMQSGGHDHGVVG